MESDDLVRMHSAEVDVSIFVDDERMSVEALKKLNLLNSNCLTNLCESYCCPSIDVESEHLRS